MRLLMIASFAAMAASSVCLAAVLLTALYIPTQHVNGPWTTNIAENISAQTYDPFLADTLPTTAR